MRREFKLLFARDEMHLSIIFCLLVASVAFIADVHRYNWHFAAQHLSAAHRAMIFRSGVGQAFTACLLPVISSFSYADSYLFESKNGCAITLHTRLSRNHYYVEKAIVVLIAGFAISVLPFVVNQIICLIAYPLEGSCDVFLKSAYDQMSLYEQIQNALFPLLHMNHPYLNNFMHMLLIGIFGSTVALLTYTSSLLWFKSRLQQFAVISIVIFIYYLFASSLNLRYLVVYLYLFADPVLGGRDPKYFYLINAFLFFVSLIFLLIKLFNKRFVDRL